VKGGEVPMAAAARAAAALAAAALAAAALAAAALAVAALAAAAAAVFLVKGEEVATDLANEMEAMEAATLAVAVGQTGVDVEVEIQAR